MEVFALFGQLWWLDLFLVALTSLLVGWTIKALHGRRKMRDGIDAVHRRCWAEQDQWLEEHESAAADVRNELDALREQHADALRTGAMMRVELDLHRQAVESLGGEVERLREETAQVEIARQGLVEERDRHIAASEQMRRQMDAARAGHRQAEQALCQQLLALDRQVGAERAAHRREIQALRDQCDELREAAAQARGDLVLLRESHAAERQRLQAQLDGTRPGRPGRDELREEIAKLLGLLDEADNAQAMLQSRINAQELQLQQGHRQIEELRAALAREREAAEQEQQRLKAALVQVQTSRSGSRLSEVVSSDAVTMCPPRPFQRSADSPQPDDLRRIIGIGPVTQAWLNRSGIWYFWQIAGWRQDELHWVARHLPRFGHRVLQQDWVVQARRLAGPVPFERRVYPARLPPGLSERRVSSGRELVAA